MLIIIGAFLSILVPYVIYRKILKGQVPENKKLYIKTFLLGATLYTLPIIVLEIIWDVFFKWSGDPTIASSFAQAFFRAALLEEAVKFFFSYRVLSRNRNLGMKEAILLAGIVGIGYGFTEKLVYGGVAMITNALIPGHMLFQWFMGYFIYKAVCIDDKIEKRKLLFLAYIVPFLIHGVWDFSLDLTGFLMEMDSTIAMPLAGAAIMLIMTILIIAVTIKTAIAISRIERQV